ncbi:MAG TPA: trypsin-like peptidase domain-containing protein [Thermoanaerobaculia bacterium]|nr:trypsin-like peptidase domain-containing protein [Thermoanaerobaculia bacterium]
MSKRWSLTLAAAAMLAAVPLTAAPVPVRLSADGELQISDAADRAARTAELHRSLVARESAKGLAQALEVKLTPEEIAAAEPREEDGRLRVGVEKAIGTVVKLTPSARFGAVASEDGMLTWSGRITSPGATAIRLHFSPFDLPESAELYVYSEEGQAFGPYTGRGPIDDGELWANTIAGEEVRLQLRVPPEDASHTRLTIAGLGYMGSAAPQASSNLCSSNASCVVNAACQSSTAVNGAKDAVASILFLSGSSYYICSGGLIADSDAASVVPYFLTANHCISTSNEASSVETYFDYQTTCSNPDCTQPYNNTGETVGSQIVAANGTGDYTLLRLSSAPTTPDGVAFYLGWSATAVANSNGVHLYRISHPKGAPQAYSAHDVDTSKPTCRTWPRGSWIYSRDVVGATEGGSSGSPVVNGSGQIVGQLSGGCGYNVNDVCDTASNATVDGAFASYYGQVSAYLAGGGSQCSAGGASCSADSQCCSSNCKGKPGARTCK